MWEPGTRVRCLAVVLISVCGLWVFGCQGQGKEAPPPEQKESAAGVEAKETAKPEQPSASTKQEGVAEEQTPVSEAAPKEAKEAVEGAAPNRGALIARGKAIYARLCAGCHGPNGDGNGPAAPYLWPKPRNFRSAKFRLVSTKNRVPTNEDLLGVLNRGMPGSAMFPFPALSDQEKRAVIAYVRELMRQGVEEELRRAYEQAGVEVDEQQLAEDVRRRTEPGELFPKPTQVPPATEQLLAQGKELYTKNCASCHGEDGKGSGVEEQYNDDGTPTRPRDFTKGYFKGEGDPATLFVRLRVGMPGSPMPEYPQLSDEQIWALVHYVRSMVPEGVEERVVHRRVELVAKRVQAALSGEISDEVWQGVPAQRIVLSPLWWREFEDPDLHVQAVHDGKLLALRLTWHDATRNDSAARLDAFDDKVAVQFFKGEEEPFLGMGWSDAQVFVWAWHAGWQRDLKGYADVETEYPRGYADWYPFARDANGRVDQENPFVTARTAGNLLADPARGVAVESAAARRFGSLSFLPKPSQNVVATATWSDGKWTVILKRSLAGSSEDELSLEPGDRVSVAFAVWDGAARDRDGQKLVSIWNDLLIEP